MHLRHAALHDVLACWFGVTVTRPSQGVRAPARRARVRRQPGVRLRTRQRWSTISAPAGRGQVHGRHGSGRPRLDLDAEPRLPAGQAYFHRTIPSGPSSVDRPGWLLSPSP
ncbi:hypothetical protein [Streptomyces werraensis]|uniref:hypothetical protein n=1 Tax=Streptomyces werraensis TaxID=68284 RepID=UPI003F4E11FD